MFLESIRRVVADDRVTNLARTMAQLGGNGAFENRDLFAEAHAERYARNLISHDPEGRFVIVGITWAPGQMSSLHDHGGLWGVEIVVDGEMRETAYSLVDRDARGRCRFVREQERTLSRHSVSVVIPPHDYHVFGNVGTLPAHTLHVYGGSLARCNAFTPESDGWWTGRSVGLNYDA